MRNELLDLITILPATACHQRNYVETYSRYNVVGMTRVLQELIDEGYPVTPEIIARLSPYKTEHINRFGHYELHFDQVPQPITEELQFSPALTVRKV
jgi:hypothetical protein